MGMKGIPPQASLTERGNKEEPVSLAGWVGPSPGRLLGQLWKGALSIMIPIAAPCALTLGSQRVLFRVKCPLYLLSSRRAGRQRRVSTGVSAQVNHTQRGWPTPKQREPGIY